MICRRWLVNSDRRGVTDDWPPEQAHSHPRVRLAQDGYRLTVRIATKHEKTKRAAALTPRPEPRNGLTPHKHQATRHPKTVTVRWNAARVVRGKEEDIGFVVFFWGEDGPRGEEDGRPRAVRETRRQKIGLDPVRCFSEEKPDRWRAILGRRIGRFGRLVLRRRRRRTHRADACAVEEETS